MILSDRTIREELDSGHLSIEPRDLSAIQPSSVDLKLGNRFLTFRELTAHQIDAQNPIGDYMEMIEVAPGEAFKLRPKVFMLGTTLERVRLPDNLVGRLEGRSSLGRIGIIVHSTAGYIDPGFEGRITLEISNLAHVPVLLYPGMRIAQISFLSMTTPAERPYGSPGLRSKYQGQSEPTASRLHLDFA